MRERKVLETRESLGWYDFDMRAKQCRIMTSGSDKNDGGDGFGFHFFHGGSTPAEAAA